MVAQVGIEGAAGDVHHDGDLPEDGLTFIDTTGLGVLVRLLVASLRDRNGTMSPVAPDGPVLRRLRRTNLVRVFPVYDTLAQALA
ncbi:STAS domain-containing protein [Nonomuraea candida]|uniref:STAS domain-containing protein n=1 Tax=Nonomuraea candida TaxID=359159 RepID=UPI000693B49E|nr:STAS domain-containing protein [Nonomuraea candida]